MRDPSLLGVVLYALTLYNGLQPSITPHFASHVLLHSRVAEIEVLNSNVALLITYQKMYIYGSHIHGTQLLVNIPKI